MVTVCRVAFLYFVLQAYLAPYSVMCWSKESCFNTDTQHLLTGHGGVVQFGVVDFFVFGRDGGFVPLQS